MSQKYKSRQNFIGNIELLWQRWIFISYIYLIPKSTIFLIHKFIFINIKTKLCLYCACNNDFHLFVCDILFSCCQDVGISNDFGTYLKRSKKSAVADLSPLLTFFVNIYLYICIIYYSAQSFQSFFVFKLIFQFIKNHKNKIYHFNFIYFFYF